MVRRMNASVPKTVAIDTSGPDFRGIEAWVFDLDHTLYTMDSDQQAAMEERICRFVQRHFAIDRDPAWEIQKRYLREHGSTLSGLVQHHGVDQDIYHDFVNDLDSLALERDEDLRAGLARLPGRRFVFTNNCGRFAAAVLDRLGVADLFADIVDAGAMGHLPKPSPASFDTLIARGHIAPAKAAMFDDSQRNLVPASALGMKTVWFNDGLGQSHWRIDRPDVHIDHETDDLASFLHSISL
jgi:putative hydrolase of the HAD superfamily